MRAFSYACHFRSRDKDSGSAIPSAVSESLNAASKLHGCTFYRTRVIVLHCGIAIFDPILLLWYWPSLDDLHTRTWSVSLGDIGLPRVQIWTSYVKTFESYLIRAGECVHLVTRGHFLCRVTKMAVTPFDQPEPKTRRYTQISWLYVLQKR